MTDKDENQPISVHRIINTIFLAVASIAVICTIGFFLFTNITWFKDNVFNPKNQFHSDQFLFIYHLFMNTVKKSVALFSAFCLIFLGTGISLYVVSKQEKLDLKTHGITVSLITHSPGVIAILLGVVLMSIIVNSPDDENLVEIRRISYDINKENSDSSALEQTYNLNKENPDSSALEQTYNLEK